MKEQVVNSAADLFQKYGIRSVSMDDIAKALSISKKTIYQYFNDKNELVKEVAGHIISDKLGAYKKVADSASSAIEELAVTAKLIRQHFIEMNPALMYDVKKFHPEAWCLFAQHEKEVIYNAVVANLKRGQKEGFFRKEIDVSIMAKIRFEQIHLTFDESVFPKEEYNMTEVHVQLFDFFIHGVLTPQGLTEFKNFENQINE